MKKSELNILIVEDEPSLRAALTEAIGRAGFKAFPAARVEEAENIVKMKTIHAAIFDVMLPTKNGVDLAVELKKGPLSSSVILLMSGIFKDKTFAEESKERTGAAEFLFKPFEPDQLIDVLDREFSHLLDEPKVALHSLIAKDYSGERERQKALECVEEITGFDLPLIFCIFMDAKSTGHLNLVDGSSEVFGVTLKEGQIVNVDSSKSRVFIKELFLEKGYLAEKDLDDLVSANKVGNLEKALVNNNLVSPHAVPIVKHQQMVTELKDLVHNQSMKISFSPAAPPIESSVGINLEEFTTLVQEFIQTRLTTEWLERFYEGWYHHPISLGPQYKGDHPLLSYSTLTKIPQLMTFLKQGPTVQELIEDQGLNIEHIYRALHLLALRRLIVFNPEKRIKGNADRVKRVKQIYADIKGKNPFEIFQYFGVDPNKEHAVLRTYKEFAKANHPDTLPLDTEEEIVKLNHALFSAITEAHEVLTDEKKKKEYLAEQQHKEVESQLQAEQMADQALSLLHKGMYREAYEQFKSALELHDDIRTQLYCIWCELKSAKGVLTDDNKQKMSRMLEGVEHENRRNALYQHVFGLFRMAQGKLDSARTAFEKALSFDPSYLPSRREIAQMNARDKSKNNDLLTGDLGSIMGNLFKKKK